MDNNNNTGVYYAGKPEPKPHSPVRGGGRTFYRGRSRWPLRTTATVYQPVLIYITKYNIVHLHSV